MSGSLIKSLRFSSLALPGQFFLPAALLGFLTRGRFLPRAIRRPFFGPLNPFVGIASLLSLASVALVALLLINPQSVDRIFPAWRGTLGIACFGFCILAIIGSLLRSFKIIALTAFWIFAACLIGKEALGFHFKNPFSRDTFDPSKIVGGEAVNLFDPPGPAAGASSLTEQALSSVRTLGDSVFNRNSGELAHSGLPEDIYYAKPYRSSGGGTKGSDLAAQLAKQKSSIEQTVSGLLDGRKR